MGRTVRSAPVRLGKDGVMLREGAGNYFKMKAILDANTQIAIQDSSKGWVKVQVIGGELGWISANVFAPQTASVGGRPSQPTAKRTVGVDRTAVGAMIKGLKQGVSAGSQALAVDIGGGNIDPAEAGTFRAEFNTTPLTADLPISAREAGLALYPELLAVSPVIAASLIEEWGGRNRGYEAYANQVVLWVAERIGASNLSPQVYVSNGGDNAICLPGGWIVVGGDLFRHLQDESELAGVLAHELAHAVFFHGRKGFAKQAHRIGIKQVFDDLDDETFDPDEEQVDVSDLESFADDVRASAQRRWSVPDEIEADSAAISWLAASGYDPTALRRFLGRLKDSMSGRLTGRGGEVTSDWLSGRTELDQRIAAADRQLKKVRVSRDAKTFADRFRRNVR